MQIKIHNANIGYGFHYDNMSNALIDENLLNGNLLQYYISSLSIEFAHLKILQDNIFRQDFVVNFKKHKKSNN